MAPRTRSSTTAIESPRCWLNAASAPMTSPARTSSTMSRCSAIVASMRAGDRKSCMRTRRMRSFTWRRKPTATSLPAAVGQADVERLVEQHEVGVGLGERAAGERAPLVAQRLEHGRVVAGAEPGRALQGLQLEPGAHLVEVAHHGDVGDDRLVAAVGVRADEALGLQPLERLADRRARHLEQRGQALLAEADVGRELADQQAGLQRCGRRGRPGRPDRDRATGACPRRGRRCRPLSLPLAASPPATVGAACFSSVYSVVYSVNG